MDMNYELDRIVTGSIACKEKSDMSSTELSVEDCVQARIVGVRRKLSGERRSTRLSFRCPIGGVEEAWPLPYLGSTRR
jgi:hypothetical protein